MLEVLTQARALIEAGWTQGTYAASAPAEGAPYGKATMVCSSVAVCFCTIGAILRVVHADDPETFFAGAGDIFVDALYDQLPPEAKNYPTHRGCLVRYNDEDGRTQAEVLELYDKAIANA